MKKYSISFYGRLKGAIGCFYSIVDIVCADDEKAAILKLYDKYDHVHQPTVTMISE